MLESSKRTTPPILAPLLILGLGLSLAALISQLGMTNSIAFSFGIVLFFLAFAKTEIALYLLIFSMLLSPEISFGTLTESGVSGGRAVVIRLDDLFLLLIAFGWLAKTALNKSLGLIEKSPLNRYIYIYTAVFTISTGIGILFGRVDPALGFFNVLKLMQYFILYFMVLNNTSSESRARRLIAVAIIVNIIIAVYSLSQIPSGERITAPFEGEVGEPNTLGGYLILMLALTLALFLETDNYYKRLMYGVFSILNLIALFYTESRSSYIGLLFMVITLTIFAKRRNLLLLGVILTVIFSGVILPDRVIERINYTFQSEEHPVGFRDESHYGGGLDASTRARLESWGAAFEGWKEHPLIGHGVTGFMFLDSQYMKVLVETGAVGMVVFLLLLANIFKAARNSLKLMRERSSFYSAVAIGFMAGFVGLCFHALGTNTFIIIRIMEPFWLIAGIVLSYHKFIKDLSPIEEPA